LNFESKFAGSDAKGLRTRTVLMVIPGGLEHGGGIGRMMGYFLRAYQSGDQRLNYRIIDSRGPWFLGSSPLHIISAVFFLICALLELLRARFSSACVAHVNITGRGSTVRKIILCNVIRALGLRYILHLHDYDYADYYRSRSASLQGLIASVFRHAATVIVLGQRELKVIPQLLGVDEDRVTVLHNAVADPKPDLDKRQHSGTPCQLLFLGHLSARKGVPDLLRALASPTLNRLSWRATLAGGGPIDEFRNLAKDLGILERVCFPGWLDEAAVSELCTSSDVLVLPSYAEGLAMSVLEGLSHGLAVLTTPVGAHREVIEPEVSGILVPPGDVTALVDALSRVIEDESLRAKLARGARNRFLEAFDVSRYAIRLEKLHAGLFELRPDQTKLVEKGLIR
jgi:glycosyltransferase involved in cell wall biosynthesis